jgi:hypothetical protein
LGCGAPIWLGGAFGDQFVDMLGTFGSVMRYFLQWSNFHSSGGCRRDHADVALVVRGSPVASIRFAIEGCFADV